MQNQAQRGSIVGPDDGEADTKITTDRVESALAEVIEARGEVGLQVCAYRNGVPIIDTWRGHASADRAREVGPGTVFPIFSVSKAVTAFAIHLQAERGLVDPDAPIATYWPEYGTKGKEAITIRHVLTHRAGVPQMPADVTPERLSDWEWVTSRLTRVAPVFPPGSRNTYLSMTFGYLLGEVVRRTDPKGRGFATFVNEEIAGPLGMDSFWFGVPESEKHRVATLCFPGQPAEPDPASLAAKAIPAQVALAPAAFNRADVQRSVVPAVGGVSNARSLVRLFALLAGAGELDGVRLLSAGRISALAAPRPDIDVPDETYGTVLPVGAGGFWVRIPGLVPPGTSVIGHTGMGGSYAWAEPSTGLAVAICHNRMVIQQPFTELVAAIRDVPADAA